MLKRPKSLDLSRYEYAEHVLTQLRSLPPGSVVFDVGAGDGRLREPVEKLGMTWVGFDLYPKSADTEKWDLEYPCPQPASMAKVVLLLDVIEHLGNPERGIRNIVSVLQLDGRLVLTTPNPLWSRSRVHAFLNGVPACFTQSDLDLNHHVFTPWPHILEKMLTDAGFEIDEYVTIDGKTRWPGRPLSLRYPIRFLHAGLNKMIERFDPSATGMSYALLARRVR